MTYDEYARQQPDYIPPPPMPAPTPSSSMGGLELGGKGDWPKPGVSLAQIMLPPAIRNLLGPRSTTNPSFTPMGGGQPSFSVPAGERAALQMPGVGEAMTRAFAARERLMNLADPQLGSVPPPPNIKDWFMKNAYDPPGFRDMPRYGGSRYEKDTQYIAPPARPEETPYPRPPWLNFSNWMDTGERGPLPLDARRPGNYPAPANRQMPEAYDARTSGGFLADAGRAAARGVAGQPLAQMSGPYAPMQNVTNTMMLAEAAKTDDERARERMRPVLDEAAQAALEPLMMRKYAEKMGYMPTPSVWKRIWRSIVDNYSGSQGGLTRVR